MTAFVPLGAMAHHPTTSSPPSARCSRDPKVEKVVHGGASRVPVARSSRDRARTAPSGHARRCLPARSRRIRLRARRDRAQVQRSRAASGRRNRTTGGGSGFARPGGPRYAPSRRRGCESARACGRRGRRAGRTRTRTSRHVASSTRGSSIRWFRCSPAMENRGVRIDLDYLNEMARDLDKRVGELETECYELAGERLEPRLAAAVADSPLREAGSQDHSPHQDRSVDRRSGPCSSSSTSTRSCRN